MVKYVKANEGEHSISFLDVDSVFSKFVGSRGYRYDRYGYIVCGDEGTAEKYTIYAKLNDGRTVEICRVEQGTKDYTHTTEFTNVYDVADWAKGFLDFVGIRDNMRESIYNLLAFDGMHLNNRYLPEYKASISKFE